MASFSDYAENNVLNHVVGKTAFAMPTAHVALFTTAPSDTGGGTEVTGGSYARVATTGATWTAAAAGATDNAVAINFPTPTASWGTVTHVGLMDAATAGNLLAWAPLSSAQTVGSGNTVAFAVGALDITLS